MFQPNARKHRLGSLVAALLIVASLLAACGPAAAPAPAPTQPASPPPPAPTATTAPAPTPAPAATPTGAPAVSQFEVVRAAAEAYLSSDKSKTPNITAEDLYLILNDGDTKNDPFILSVRAPADYEKGHVPGAVNIPWREIGKKDNLAKLPKNQKIVVYCYTGHTGSQVTAALNALGYDAVNLRFGMTSWTKNLEVGPGAFNKAKDQKDYKVEKEPNEAKQTFDPPALNVTAASAAADILQAAVEAYFSSDKTKKANMDAEELFMLLNDGDTKNDPFILSVRQAKDYAIGHVPGAVNIFWRELGSKENLAKLPTDRLIVVYCYTGHTGSQATALLNMMGYNAINLKFGMCSWTPDPEVALGCFDPAKHRMDYRYVSGKNPN